jgi:hypothetical protein
MNTSVCMSLRLVHGTVPRCLNEKASLIRLATSYRHPLTLYGRGLGEGSPLATDLLSKAKPKQFSGGVSRPCAKGIASLRSQ